MAHKDSYSTAEAAKKAKIGTMTLRRWLASGKVDSSIKIELPWGKILRRWTDADIVKLAKYADEHLNEREGGR